MSYVLARNDDVRRIKAVFYYSNSELLMSAGDFGSLGKLTGAMTWRRHSCLRPRDSSRRSGTVEAAREEGRDESLDS